MITWKEKSFYSLRAHASEPTVRDPCPSTNMSSGGRRRKQIGLGRRLSSTKSDNDTEGELVVVEPQFTGGYDFDFVEGPLEELTCSICHLVLRNPHLTSCCGNHFCQSCIESVQNECSPCPLCKDTSFTTFLDKSFQRKVNELEILCPRSEDGCTWTGTVGTAVNHLDSVSGDCEYTEIKCELCSEEIQRKNILNHKKDECANRPFTCKYCGYSKTWIEVTSKHSKKCVNYPLQCPNKCGIGTIERKNLNTHIKVLCPLQVEPCAFEFAGCSVQVPRKDSAEHLAASTATHVTLLAGVCAEYKSKLDAKQEKVDELQATVKSLNGIIKSHDSMIHSLNQRLAQLQVSQLGGRPLLGGPIFGGPLPVFPPADFYLVNLNYFKQTNKKWVSKPFYTHPGGYKMCLCVFANGIGKGKNSQMHISVTANLMKGEFDSELEWPFYGDVFVSLHLESSEDIVKIMMFGPKSHVKATQRVTEGDMNDFGQGDLHFTHYSKLAPLNNLHFTVLRVNWKSAR